jgi:hypothetical protein
MRARACRRMLFGGLCSKGKYPIEGSRSFSGTLCDIHTRRGGRQEEEEEERTMIPVHDSIFGPPRGWRLEPTYTSPYLLCRMRWNFRNYHQHEYFFHVQARCDGCRSGLDKCCESSKTAAKSPSRLDPTVRDTPSNDGGGASFGQLMTDPPGPPSPHTSTPLSLPPGLGP